jgi:outer membrane murein-binding lipoprotein Lpp
MRVPATFLIVVTGSIFLAGCSKDPDILDQAKAIKGQPAPSAEQMKKGFAQIAANHQQAADESNAWAKAHPDQVAKVNAQRAAAGMAPLGQ